MNLEVTSEWQKTPQKLYVDKLELQEESHNNIHFGSQQFSLRNTFWH